MFVCLFLFGFFSTETLTLCFQSILESELRENLKQLLKFCPVETYWKSFKEILPCRESEGKYYHLQQFAQKNLMLCFSAQNLIFIILHIEHKYQYDTMDFYLTDEIVKPLQYTTGVCEEGSRGCKAVIIICLMTFFFCMGAWRSQKRV